MNIEEIVEAVKKSIEEISLGNVSISSITADSKILDDLSLDSLDYASLLLGFEDLMKIKISEEGVNWREIQTVQQISEFIFKQSNK